MKKRALTLLLALAMIVSLAACGGGSSNSAAGSYKLTEVNSGGVNMNLEELTASTGVELDVALELKDDGNFSLDMTALGQSGSLTGTWKADGDNLVLTAEGGDLPVSYDGTTIVMEHEDQSLTFVKE